MGLTNGRFCSMITSLWIVAGKVTINTGKISRSSSGGLPLQNGTLMRPRSIAAPPPSTIRINVAIVIHNYRWRLGLAEGETQYDELEKRLAAAPTITVPTI